MYGYVNSFFLILLFFRNVLVAIGLPQNYQNPDKVLAEKFYKIPWELHITTESPTSKILTDIRNAFLIVSNKSQDINKLIPKMYNMTNNDPIYVFKLPDHGNKLLMMQKSDFVQPTFPNLTKSYMRLMRSPTMLGKLKSVKHGGIKSSRTLNSEIFSSEDPETSVRYNVITEKNFINFVMSLNDQYNRLKPFEDLSSLKETVYEPQLYEVEEQSTNSNDWEVFGLEGWQGLLSETEFIESTNGERISESKPNQNKSHKTKKEEPKIPFRFATDLNEIWDLPGHISSQHLANSSVLRMSDNSVRNKMTWPVTKPRNAHKNKDVFIARVNDPFGHSTKWSLKNTTNGDSPLEDDRKKRAIGELYSMIKCSTGCDPLIYKGYGCYCGFLGSGVPVNGIDRCCKLHDKCYERSNCVSYLEYFVPYIWKCYRGKPLCALDHGEWGGPNSCADRLCQCDLQLSRCLRKFICPRQRAVCKSSAIRTLQNYLMIF